MIRADGCFATLKYLIDNGSSELFDEEFRVYAIDTFFESLKTYVIECQTVNEGYEGDTEEGDSFDSGYTPNDTEDPDYILEEPMSIAQSESVEVFVPEPVEPEFIIISDSDSYTPAPQPPKTIIVRDSDEEILDVAASEDQSSEGDNFGYSVPWEMNYSA